MILGELLREKLNLRIATKSNPVVFHLYNLINKKGLKIVRNLATNAISN